MFKFTFKLLTTTELGLLCKWFAKPHVLEWWNDHLTSEEIIEKYKGHISNKIYRPYVVYSNDKPIAFIQYYWASKVGAGWWPDENASTIGLDQFIGEEDYINKGYGTLMLREFIQFSFRNTRIKKIITEAAPNNLRAKPIVSLFSVMIDPSWLNHASPHATGFAFGKLAFVPRPLR